MKSDEFPGGAAEWPNDFSRREFIRLAGASLALAGAGGCTKQPVERIVPYVKQPQGIVPGNPLHFATATTLAGFGQGIIVTSREGRPIKIEGNPDHPASLGATSIWAQADLLDLYDPDRAKTVMQGESISTWPDFGRELNLALAAQQATGGAGLRLLTETITSPTVGAQLEALGKKFPHAKWHQWAPINRGGLAGTETIYDLAKARVIVALDSDFLFMHPAALRYAREFAAARRATDPGQTKMNRLYVAEPTPTITGANADHRMAIAAHDIKLVAEEIAARITAKPSTEPNKYAAWFEGWMQAVVNDLMANRGAGAVLAGHTQPVEVHRMVELINRSLGNFDSTSSMKRPAEIRPSDNAYSMRQLTEQMKSGAVEVLMILGGDPVYNAPVDLEFGGALEKVKLRIHHSLFPNDTSRKCHWLIPASHFLESWGDVRAFDGSISIIQPLIEPLYATVSIHDVIGALIQAPTGSAYDIVRENWRSRNHDGDFELNWRRALSDGVFQYTPAFETFTLVEPSSVTGHAGGDLEIVFRPDPNILDGRYANNGWLQELPRPFTKLTWENAALVSPSLAGREKLENGDVVELTFRGRKLSAPILIQPGQAEDSVTLHLGYGRNEIGRIGRGAGFNAYALRRSDALWFGKGLTMRKTGAKHLFATTQNHYAMEGRDLVRSGTLADFAAEPKRIAKRDEQPKDEETLYNPGEFANRGYGWGMVIDLGACIGCSACTIACQAENNIPVVGKAQVMRGREMHWIRVDTYYSGEPDNPRFAHQPVPCMHCEHAPCELVCPVGATVHDAEGLNVQVYNRCVGTRYCSNNCPYKVRRFNFLELNWSLSATEKLVKNPEVTVRSRGVMEKCTYCVQRIEVGRITAELARRKIRDGEVVPACAQVCPTEAIVFGDIHDPQSRVSKLKQSPLNYAVLAELNTRPRTTYLAKLRNPKSEPLAHI